MLRNAIVQLGCGICYKKGCKMRLNNCKTHNKSPFSYLWADYKNLICKWVVCCPACKGINKYTSKETMFKVIYSKEIDEMRKETEEKWNKNNAGECLNALAIAKAKERKKENDKTNS